MGEACPANAAHMRNYPGGTGPFLHDFASPHPKTGSSIGFEPREPGLKPELPDNPLSLESPCMTYPRYQKGPQPPFYRTCMSSDHLHLPRPAMMPAEPYRDHTSTIQPHPRSAMFGFCQLLADRPRPIAFAGRNGRVRIPAGSDANRSQPAIADSKWIHCSQSSGFGTARQPVSANNMLV